MEHYIGVLATEGVTFVPIWTEPPEKAAKAVEMEVAKEEDDAEAEKDSETKKLAEGGTTVAQVSLDFLGQT